MTTGPGVRATTAYLNVGHTYAHLVMLLYPTAVLAMEGVWGLGYAELLPLGFVGYLLFGVGSLPAGWLADRWSSTAMMVLFFLGTGVACMVTGLATGPWTLALGLTAIGLVASIYHPVAIAWLVGSSDRPGRTLGFNGVFGSIGVAGASLVAGALADLVHWRAAFLIPGITCLAVGAMFTFGVGRGRLVMVRGAYRQGESGGRSGRVGGGLLLVLCAILFTGLVFQIASVGLPKIFQERLGDAIGPSALAAGSLVSLVYAISAFGQIIGGAIADRYDERWLYPASYALQVVLLVLALPTFGAWLVPMVAAMVTVQLGTQPIENCLLARYTPEDWRATVYGLKFVLALGLSALGVPLIAWIYASSGRFDGVFWVLIGCSMTVIALGLALCRRGQGALPAGIGAQSG